MGVGDLLPPFGEAPHPLLILLRQQPDARGVGRAEGLPIHPIAQAVPLIGHLEQLLDQGIRPFPAAHEKEGLTRRQPLQQPPDAGRRFPFHQDIDPAQGRAVFMDHQQVARLARVVAQHFIPAALGLHGGDVRKGKQQAREPPADALQDRRFAERKHGFWGRIPYLERWSSPRRGGGTS